MATAAHTTRREVLHLVAAGAAAALPVGALAVANPFDAATYIDAMQGFGSKFYACVAPGAESVYEAFGRVPAEKTDEMLDLLRWYRAAGDEGRGAMFAELVKRGSIYGHEPYLAATPEGFRLGWDADNRRITYVADDVIAAQPCGGFIPLA